MKTVYVWITLLVAFGIALSFYLLPSKEDDALIQLKGNRDQPAEEYYQQQYQQGVRTANILIPLSHLQERQGKIQEAISLMEEYVAANPVDVLGLQRLEDLYLANQEYEKFFQTLLKRRIQARAADKASLKDALKSLANWYQSQNAPEELLKVLEELRDSGNADEDDLLNLAYLYASKQHYEQASRLLEARRKSFPTATEYNQLLFEVWVDQQLNNDRKCTQPLDDKDVELMAAYLMKKRDKDIVYLVINTVSTNYPRLARPLTDRLEPIIRNDPRLEALVLQARFEEPSEKGRVLKRLRELTATPQADPGLQNLAFNAFLSEKDDDSLIRLIRTMVHQGIEERTIFTLSLAALDRKNPMIAQEMEKALGPNYLKSHLVIAVELAIGGAAPDAKERLNGLIQSGSLTATESYFFFKLALAARFDNEALALLDKLPSNSYVEDSDLIDIAVTYIQMKKVKELYIITEKLEKNKAEPIIGLLELSQGRPEKALEWLSKHPNISQPILSGYYTIAEGSGNYSLALYVAQRLKTEHPSAEMEASYALALVQVGRVESGLTILKRLHSEHPKDTTITAIYIQALDTGWNFSSAKAMIVTLLRDLADPAFQNISFRVFLSEKDDTSLIHLIQTTPAQNIEERLIFTLSLEALNRKNPVIAKEMEKALGQEYLKSHPVVAVELAIGTLAPDAKQRLNSIIQTGPLTATESYFLLKLALAARFDNEAMALLNKVPSYSGIEDSDLIDIAVTYIQMKKNKEIYAITEKLGKEKAEPIIALLELSEGRPEKALEWLSKHPTTSQALLSGYYTIAEESGNYALALYVAQRLKTEHPSPEMEASYALALVQVGRIESGLTILKRLHTAYPKDAVITAIYIQALVIGWDSSEKALTATFLSELTDPAFQNISFKLFLSEKDDTNLIRLIRKTSPQSIEERTLFNLSLEALKRKNPLLAKEMEKALGEDYLKSHPVVAVELAIGGHSSDAQERLKTLIQKGPLTPTENFFLFKLAIAARFDNEALALLEKLPSYSTAEDDELIDIVVTAIQAKRNKELYAMTAKLDAAKAGPIIGLLDLSEGRPEKAVEWLSKHPTASEALLSGYYTIAVEKEDYWTALYVAKRLKSVYPSPEVEADYALALVQVGRVEGGLAILKRLHAEHPKEMTIEGIYIQALSIGIKTAPQHRPELTMLLGSQKWQGELEEPIKRQIAYIRLESLHDYERASHSFQELSEKAAPDSPDVQALVYLWGPNASSENILWIEKRVDEANDHEFGYWLEHLNTLGAYCRVIDLFERRHLQWFDKTASYAYLEALAATRNYETLKVAVESVLSSSKERKQLDQLASYTELANDLAGSRRIWQRIASEWPNDPIAWQNLGKAASDQHDYCAAAVALRRFFESQPECNPRLYESLFLYGEIMTKWHHYSTARSYYLASLSHIDAATDWSYRMLEIKALALDKLHDLCSSQAVMRERYDLANGAPDIAASYANLLLDQGYVHEAGKLLNCR